jgi:hypothetical protein
LINPFSFDYATSVVPGWHTTILPPYFIAGIIVTITLLTDYFIFMKLTKINSITPKKIVIAHFIITTVMVIFLKYPELYFDFINSEHSITEIISIMENIKYAFLSFIVLQIIYYFYLLKIFLKK